MKPVMKIVIGLLVITFAVLASPFDAPVVLCESCSNPPPCYGRCPNGTWWSSYSAWCSRCGGTPYQNSSGGGCTPGPKWAGASAGGGGGSSLPGLGNLPGFSGGGLTSQQQLGLGLLGMGLSAMMQGASEASTQESQRRQQEQEEARQREAAERARIEAEHARLAEEQHQKLMGSLKGSFGASFDGRAPSEGPSTLQLKSGTALFGIPSNPSGTLLLDDTGGAVKAGELMAKLPEPPPTPLGRPVAPSIDTMEKGIARQPVQPSEPPAKTAAKTKPRAPSQEGKDAQGTGKRTAEDGMVPMVGLAQSVIREMARGKQETETCRHAQDTTEAPWLAMEYSLQELRQQLTTTQNVLRGLADARRNDAAERATWENEINQSVSASWELAREMGSDIILDHLQTTLTKRLKEADSGITRTKLRWTDEVDPHRSEQLQIGIQWFEREKETIANAMKRLEEVKNTRDVAKLDVWANSNEKDAKKFWEGMHDVTDKVLGDSTIQKALKITPGYGQAIKYGKHMIDSAHLVTTELVGWKRIRELNKDSEEYLQQVNGLQDRIKNLVEAIKLKERTLSLSVCEGEGGTGGGPLCVCVKQVAAQ